MNLSSYDLINVEDFTVAKGYASLGEHTGKLVIAGVNMLPIQTVTLATEQTVAGYTFTTAGYSVAQSTTMAVVGKVVSALGYIGAIIAVALVVNSYLSSMWAVDSIKRQRDRFLTMFRRIKRLNRIADINNVVYGNMKNYLESKYKMLEEYEKTLNDTNLEIRNFIPAKTNTYLLSNPIINFLQNEQNVLDIIKTNNYNYIKVISFIDYEKDINILELDKIRIANADINTLKAYIDNLNAILVLTDKLETFKLYEQVIKDINFIKNNVNILLNEIKKTYIEQLNTQDIDNPLQMLEEITNDIPFLDLSAQTEDIGGLSLYPNEYIANDIPILFNTLNKKDIMILVFNNIYIKKFILLINTYYHTEENLQQDTLKYLNSSINTYNLLSEIISLKNLKEKNYNQVLPNKNSVERYRLFTYFKKLLIEKTKTFILNYGFNYRKSNNVKVKNGLILNEKIYKLDDYFYNKNYKFNDYLFYFDFNTNDDNERIDNIDINTIDFTNFEQQYFDYISDIRTQIKNYGIDIIYLTDSEIDNVVNQLKDKLGFFGAREELGKNEEYYKTRHILNLQEFVYYFIWALTKIQKEINSAYEKCNYKTYTYSFNKIYFNENLFEQKETKTIRIKECILISDIVDEQISNLESLLYQVRQDYKYEYSVFSDLFLCEQSYFLFELFSKIETLTNSSVALIKQTELSVNNANYNINFYDIMYEFFTKYINNYSGYIYSKNNYLKTLTDITQSNFVSVLQIACDYKPLNLKIETLKEDTINLKQEKISQTELKDIIELSTDIVASDILANEEIKKPNINKDNTLLKVASIIVGGALLSN